MSIFGKKTFRSISDFWKELRWLLNARRELRDVLNGTILTEAFRERLFMAVTSVNRCRYCSFVHTRAALKSGVTAEELKGFLAKEADTVPESERVAVIYAQHWADSGGAPDPEAVKRLNDAYPPEMVSAINLAIRFINFNNLFGNTVDRILHAVSFGLLGGGK